MSKKSVSIVVPKKVAAATGESVPDAVAPNGGGGVDIWVSQNEVGADEMKQGANGGGARQNAPSSASADGLTFTIPAEPGWADLAQSLFVPQVVFWSWTVATAKKNFKLLFDRDLYANKP
jgi:hypothetical protein